MRNIRITDMTMRQTGKSAGCSLSFREKIELVKLLDRLNVSVIEVSPITSPKIDRLLIKSISSAVKESTVAVSVGLKEENIDLAWAALEEHPRVFAGSMAALGWPESHSALDALARALEESETKPRALLYLGAKSAPDTPSGQNVLCILRGAEESAGTLEGYFAEGSARRTVTPAQQDGREWRRAALPHVCNWLGSSLGHPRDGVYGYDESLSAPCRALLLAAAVCALLSLLSLPFALWKKRGHGA